MSTVIHGLLEQPISDALTTRVQQIYVPTYGSDWANVSFSIDVKKFRCKPVTVDSLDLQWTIQAGFCADIYISMTADVQLHHATEVLLDLKLNPITTIEPDADATPIGTKAANFTLKPIGSHEEKLDTEYLTVMRCEIETGYLLERIDKTIL